MVARLILAVLVAAGISASGPAWAMHAKASNGPTYQIYLLKGLAEVFSGGLDTLAAKLRARGITAEVYSHAVAESLAQSTIANWRAGRRGPIIIAGHSLGADAAVLMAQRLKDANVPVALLVTFGPVDTTPVPSNVGRAVNYFQSNSAWHGRTLKGPGFRGVLENVDLAQAAGITHFNIEKSDRLQAETMAKVLQIVSGRVRPERATRSAIAPDTSPAVTGTGEQRTQN